MSFAMVLVIAERLTYSLVCDNGACWVPGCFALRLNWQCPSGDLQIQKVGWILKTVCFVSLICVLQMTSSFFEIWEKKVKNVFDSSMRHLASAGLVLNSSKTVALTTKAQPPWFTQVGDGHMIKVLRHTEILLQWNVQVTIFIDRTNIKTRSHICCLSYWKLAQHMATLPQKCWVRRILQWCRVRTYRNWSPTFSLGVKTSILLPVQSLGAMDSRCYGSQPLGSTLRIFHWILLYIKRFDSILCSMHVE